MYQRETSKLWTKVNLKFPQLTKTNKLITLEMAVHLCKGYEEVRGTVVITSKYAIGTGINDNAMTVYEYDAADKFYSFKEEIINIYKEFVEKINT